MCSRHEKGIMMKITGIMKAMYLSILFQTQRSIIHVYIKHMNALRRFVSMCGCWKILLRNCTQMMKLSEKNISMRLLLIRLQPILLLLMVLKKLQCIQRIQSKKVKKIIQKCVLSQRKNGWNECEIFFQKSSLKHQSLLIEMEWDFVTGTEKLLANYDEKILSASIKKRVWEAQQILMDIHTKLLPRILQLIQRWNRKYLYVSKIEKALSDMSLWSIWKCSNFIF